MTLKSGVIAAALLGLDFSLLLGGSDDGAERLSQN